MGSAGALFSVQGGLGELLAFAGKEALSCAFALFIFAMLGLSHWLSIPGLPRYDLLLLACLGFQALVVRAGHETREELAVISLFHAIGLGLEMWKVHLGSWSYPGHAWTKVLGVPLVSGFMYAAVGSYVCQAWRRLDLHFHGWPSSRVAALVSAGIYGNFLANRHLPDVRWALFALVALVFARSKVTFVAKDGGPRRRMPVLLSFLLIGLFIWLAENIATFLGAWRYPNQHSGWKPVYLQKLTSWWLLVIVSIVLVAELKRRGRSPTVCSAAERPQLLRQGGEVARPALRQVALQAAVHERGQPGIDVRA